MAFKKISFLTLFFSLSLSILSSLADNNSKIPPQKICDSTVDPTFCKTLLANQNGTVIDYGRFSIRKSLSQSQNLLNLVNSHLQNKSSLSQPTISALQDCQFLAQQNFEYLSNTHQTANSTSNVLSISQSEEFQTILSAVLTNQQTCLDGLSITNSDQTAINDLTSTLSNDAKIHSVSLALFLKGWVRDNKKQTSWPQNGRHLNFRNGRLPLKMSNGARAIYDSARNRRHGRKLLQTVDESVTVSEIVVVNQDGSGNFTTINDAINVAPNNTVASSGYFLIFVTEGVYQEYVSIPKNKKYLMMVGDGINRTIITGDHNVVDNFTTFNSATFGKQKLC
jgi:pectinesterase